MRIFSILFTFLFIISLSSFGQITGFIYKPSSSTIGRSVLDPNSDGFCSNNTSGFSSSDHGTNSELKFVSVPSFSTETNKDLKSNEGNGHTDLVSDGENQSVYLLTKTVNGIDYLIVRFRLDGKSSSGKGYSVLFDTDNNISNNYNSRNIGFEKEVVLETGKRVAIYSHNSNGATLLKSYDIESNHQRSVAKSFNSNDEDYFYDFFVPLSELGITTSVRFVAATVNSAKSALVGEVCDYHGLKDSQYKCGNSNQIKSLVNSCSPVNLGDIRENYQFQKLTTVAPVITSQLYTSSTKISGTIQECSGATITIYKGTTVLGTTTVNDNKWSLNNISGLIAGNEITAKAQTLGKNQSVSSNTVVVQLFKCQTQSPLITNRTNNSKIISGTYSGTTSNVRIKLYRQTSGYNFEDVPGNSCSVNSDGTWSFTVSEISQSTLNSYTIYAVATDYNSNCSSLYSSVSLKNTGTIGVKSIAPSITTTEILASSTSVRQVTVKNNGSSAAKLYLYNNNTLIGSTSSTVAANGTYTFSYTGFAEGDRVCARALTNLSNYWLSDISNVVSVTTTLLQTSAPTISGTYSSGTNMSVFGSCDDLAGTIVKLYKGSSVLGVSEVDAFGNWEVDSLALNAGDVLIAYANAINKSLSAQSNSITVTQTPPNAPTVSGPIYVENTVISGTSGVGVVTVYVDGTVLGTTSGSNWVLTNFDPSELYKGGKVYATNTLNGAESIGSDSISIEGVVAFDITDLDGHPLTKRLKEDPFQVKVIAKKCINCSDSLHTSFRGKATLGCTNPMILGNGETPEFNNGVLITTVELTGEDTTAELIAAHIFDPTAHGKSRVHLSTPKAELNLNQVICEGTTPQNLFISTNYPNIVKWQKSDDENFTISSDINITDTVLNAQHIGEVTGTKYFRAVLKSYGNNINYSNNVSIKSHKMSGADGIIGGGKYCQGNAADLNIQNLTGDVQKWHKSSTSDFSSFEEINDTSRVLHISEVNQKAYYRALVQNGTCPSKTTTSVDVDYDNKPLGGKIFGATICQGYNRTMTLENYSGTILKWETSSSPDYSNSQVINTTSNTYTINNLQNTTYFRVHVVNGVCPISYSIGGMIIATPMSVGGNLTGNSTVCAGDTSAKLNLSGYNGTITKWQSSPYANFAGNVTEYNNPTTSMYVGSTTSPTYYRAVVKNGICPFTTSNPILININTPSYGGTITGSTAVCVGNNSATLKVINYNGNINYWESSTNPDFTQDVVNIQNITNTLNLQNLTETRYYRAVVTNGVCAPSFSSVGSVVVSQFSNGGQLPEIVQVCSGRNNLDLMLNGNVGSVLRWYKSTTADFSSNVGIVYNNTATLSLVNMTASAYYRAEVMSSGCPSTFSSTAFVQVNPTPEIGQINGATSICAGAIFNLSIQGYSGQIVKWQKSSTSDFSSNVSDINSVSSLISDSLLNVTTYYRAIISNGICEIPSQIAQMFVYPALGAISVVSGNANVYGLTTASYSIPAVNNAIAYEWNLPAGMKVVGSTNGNIVNVQIDDIFISGPISVKAIGNCSVSDTRWLLLTNEYIPSSVLMEGPTVVCVSSPNSQSYSIPTVAGATYYRWTLPSGVNLTQGTNPSSNSINLDFSTSFASGYVSVKAEDANGRVLASSSKAVESFIKPISITGPNNLCGLTTATFSTPVVADATSYGWMFPTGISIVSGSTTNTVTVSISDNAVVTGYAKVQAIGACGSSTYLSIPISKLPTPGTIVGHEVTCGVTSYTISKFGEITPFVPSTLIYRVLPIEGASAYNWSIPEGVTLVSGQGTQAVEVSVPNGFNVGQIAVSATNSTGLCSSASRSKTISSVLAIISGPSSLCGLSTATYSVPTDAGVNFQWTIPSWMTLVGGSLTSSSITVNFSQPICSAGTIVVNISSNCGGGNSYSLNVGCSEYTKIQDSQNNAVISSVTPVVAVAVPNAVGYRFRITGLNSNGIVIDKTTNNFSFSELPIVSYGLSYTVEVAYKTSLTDFGSYGCLTSIMLRNTKIQSSQCGISNLALTTPIYADAVSGATAYKFEVSGNGINSSNPNVNGVYEIITPNRYFAFNQVPGVSFGSTYNVRVAVKNPDNVTYSDYSEACQLTIQTTKLQSTQCGISGVAANTAIYANAISGATGYRFEISGPGLNTSSNSNGTFVYETSNRFFYFNQVPGMIFGSDYQVRVAAKNPDNTNFGNYGDVCTLSLKTTQVQLSQQNISEVANTVLIYADALNNAVLYRFEVTGPGLSTPIIISSSNRYFTFSQVTGAIFGETYSIRVSTATSTGVYGSFGTSSTVSLKTTQIQASQVNNVIAYTNTTLIYADALNGATAYRFEISDLDGNVLQVLDKTIRYFSFTELTNVLASGNYNIRVSAKNSTGTVFGRYGSVGMVFVSLPSTGRQMQESDSTTIVSTITTVEENRNNTIVSDETKKQEVIELNTNWDFIVLGNPFNLEFGISISSDTDEVTKIQILDMSGKIVSEVTDAPAELNALKYGQNLPNGSYFIKVIQGLNSKVIKVIKA